jgi:Flp pilus assembly protein TadD
MKVKPMLMRYTVGYALLTAALLVAVGCQSASRRDASAAGVRDTDRARQLNERAYRLLNEGKHAEAEKLLHEALAADMTFGPARNNLGLVYYQTGRWYEAAWEFEYAVRLMPFQPEPRNNLGMVLEEAGKLTDAAQAYAKAREIEPDNPLYIGNLAKARIRRGDRDAETKALLEELLLKDPRPEWKEWARLTLFQIARPADGETELPATRPAQ